uniref:Uncharacterized protein n=1 Tax=Knipowitschia caucasica TaxID=637954 RepID=A0AAV2M5N2_KNICA
MCGVVDSCGLWRRWTLRLNALKKNSYNASFWRMLRRWRVSSAALRTPCFTRLTAELPHLRALSLCDITVPCGTDVCSGLTHLTRLYLTRCTLHMELHHLLQLLPSRLTHLYMCECGLTNLDSAALVRLRALTQLRYFAFHGHSNLSSVHKILAQLPELRYLSLCVAPTFSTLPCPSPLSLPLVSPHPLLSLELLSLDSSSDVPLDLMKNLSSLRSLTVMFKAPVRPHPSVRVQFGQSEEQRLLYLLEVLVAWLKDLSSLASSSLSALLLENGPPLQSFLQFIPSSVTRLSLHALSVRSEDLHTLSTHLPQLQHLQLLPLRPLDLDSVSLLLELFPHLHLLCLHLPGVPLVQLDMKELQDLRRCPPSRLLSRVQQLRQVQTQEAHQESDGAERELLSCGCLHLLPTTVSTWAETGLKERLK